MILTFRKGYEALACLKYHETTISGHMITVKLKAPNWKDMVIKELNSVKSNTAALFNATSNCLLGEDFTIRSMSFDVDGMYLIILSTKHCV